MFTFELQPPGVLHVETEGFWTVADADAYIAALDDHLMRMRRTQGHALVVVDGRKSSVQSAPVMERVAGIQSILIRNPNDRAAYVVESSLAKLQAQRLSSTEQLKVFLSPSAARTWVLAYHTSRPDG
jgi:hypothetical protein